MADWAPKRFWKETRVVAESTGFAIHLDGRVLRTPQKAVLVLPTEALAQLVAAEWEAQQDRIDPETMPATRSANSAIDKLVAQKEAVTDMLAAYGETDLLCYRAERPLALVSAQAEAWNPVLAWAETALGVTLQVTSGVIPVAQPPESLARLRAEIAALDVFRLAGFHDLVAISGSLLLALALTAGRIDVDQAWAASRLDEDWQASQWGVDEEAAAAEAVRQAAFVQAYRFFELCG
ncbi:ATPase [Xinfangfangia sp. D13-10-4-6]|uniref:ATP12 family chaperone protein n=1 Tax=Pseudogemmobacter hezensis TaxID=2737662 RepID=UPI001552EEFC|nr:ATP12 family protein [Pseudogemmobacter hezensis]NPD17678.1 ATPase [Pseudogemmobacter hezensis]